MLKEKLLITIQKKIYIYNIYTHVPTSIYRYTYKNKQISMYIRKKITKKNLKMKQLRNKQLTINSIYN